MVSFTDDYSYTTIMFVTIVLFCISLVAAEFDPELHELYKTLPKSEFVKIFNSRGHSWTATEYGDDVPMYLGATLNYNLDLPVMTHAPLNLPDNFDSRQKWPQCKTISEIYDQGPCGSCFLFGSLNTASDRTCIHAGVQVRLAEQEGNCVQNHVCDGGDPMQVLEFWINKGVVTKNCKKYNIPELEKNQCIKQCDNSSLDYNSDKHFGKSAYRLEGSDLQAELFKNGPVQAAFTVYEDFQQYNGGIYEHKYGDKKADHSVRVVGYGVENGKEYWLAANSWGTVFGENGFFRIKRYQQELGFENYLMSALPKEGRV